MTEKKTPTWLILCVIVLAHAHSRSVHKMTDDRGWLILCVCMSIWVLLPFGPFCALAVAHCWPAPVTRPMKNGDSWGSPASIALYIFLNVYTVQPTVSNQSDNIIIMEFVYVVGWRCRCRRQPLFHARLALASRTFSASHDLSWAGAVFVFFFFIQLLRALCGEPLLIMGNFQLNESDGRISDSRMSACKISCLCFGMNKW